MSGSLPPRCLNSLGVRLGERVCRRRPLGPEDERELALRCQPALGGTERRAGLAEVERAEHVLVEVAVLTARGLRLRHRSPLNNTSASRATHRFAEFAGSSREAPLAAHFSGGRILGRYCARLVELVTGGTGYVGGRLLLRLAAEGRPVRALARQPELLPGLDAVPGDLLTGAGLEEALEGCSTAYYLVHSMEPAANGDFAARDRRMAQAFGEAAARGRARLDRVQGVDRDRRRVVVVSSAGAARGALARAAAAPLAQQPHPAHRRARRNRVPRPYAAGA